MSAGGIINKVVDCDLVDDEEGCLWICTKDENYPNQEGTSIYVRKNKSKYHRYPKNGDFIWWQGKTAFWSPNHDELEKDYPNKWGSFVDMELEKVYPSMGEYYYGNPYDKWMMLDLKTGMIIKALKG